MLRNLIETFLVGLTLSATVRAQAPCADPTPNDSAWWQWHQLREKDGVIEMQAPEPPGQPDIFRLAMLHGTFAMKLTPTTGPDRGQRIEGIVQIATDTTGSVRASTAWPTYLTFASDSMASARVQPLDVLFDVSTRRLTFIIGNRGLRSTDAGVMLEVFEANRSYIGGRWVDGGLRVNRLSNESQGLHPQGWFCLTRVRK